MDKLKTSKYTLNGFNTIFSSRPLKNGGGSAIFINNKLKYNIITQYSDNNFLNTLDDHLQKLIKNET